MATNKLTALFSLTGKGRIKMTVICTTLIVLWVGIVFIHIAFCKQQEQNSHFSGNLLVAFYLTFSCCWKYISGNRLIMTAYSVRHPVTSRRCKQNHLLCCSMKVISGEPEYKNIPPLLKCFFTQHEKPNLKRGLLSCLNSIGIPLEIHACAYVPPWL